MLGPGIKVFEIIEQWRREKHNFFVAADPAVGLDLGIILNKVQVEDKENGSWKAVPCGTRVEAAHDKSLMDRLYARYIRDILPKEQADMEEPETMASADVIPLSESDLGRILKERENGSGKNDGASGDEK